MPREIITGTTGVVSLGTTYTLGESLKIVQRFAGSAAACRAAALYKGAIGTGALTGYAVQESLVADDGDDQNATLTINWAWNPNAGIPPPGGNGAVDLPLDTHGVKNELLDVPVERLLPYSKLLGGVDKYPMTGVDPIDGVVYGIVTLIKQAVQNEGESYNILDRVLAYNLAGTDLTIAQNLWKLLVSGHTHKRFWLPVYRWTSYYWWLPPTDGGGSVTGNPGGPGGGTLAIAHQWLRMADDYDHNGTHWVLVRSWMGVPNTGVDGTPGGWEKLLYP